MATTTPRRSTRIPHMHTPMMSERKKGLFQGRTEPTRESLTKHRHLPVVDSESDSEDCDLGIISTLDSSSGEENDQGTPKTPSRRFWPETRSQTKRLLKENQDLKNFIRSPFTLKKYQTRYSCPEVKCSGSMSTPATPHIHNHPGTPSSTHSCASAHTTSSTSSRARKSLASLIADTESCSSSLKDLNFDTDSGNDSKENTPSKAFCRSNNKQNTPQRHSFKGILVEQKKNVSPVKTAVVCLTRVDFNNDFSSLISPTQMLKTPHTTDPNQSPPKIGHNRRVAIEIGESPDSACDSDKSHKRLRHDSVTDVGPNSKNPRLDNTAPKARLSLFNSDRLKQILSAKSFYGKSNPEINTNVATKISNAIEQTHTYHRRTFSQSHSHRRKRKPGQINMGVKHKIRKPKILKNHAATLKGNSYVTKIANTSANTLALNTSALSNASNKDRSMRTQDLTIDKIDPFDKEKKTIEALLSQWTEDEVPDTELSFSKPDVPCFNSSVIEETNAIFQPVTAIPVAAQTIPEDKEAVIVELESKKSSVLLTPVTDFPKELSAQDVVMVESGHKQSHGEIPLNGQFLPVEGGYLYVEDDNIPDQEHIPDLDEINRELRMLDEQILKTAQSNNIDASVLTSTLSIDPVIPDTDPPSEVAPEAENLFTTLREPNTGTICPSSKEMSSDTTKSQKLFPIFSNPNPGVSAGFSKETVDKSKKIIKTGMNQYIIDAGQKKFGATQCTECGVIYQIGDPVDEYEHTVHHTGLDVLKFNGFKGECVVGNSATGRCIRIRSGESGWRRVESLLSRIVHPYLGYNEMLPSINPHTYTAYLYIMAKQIVGCLIVELKTKAHKLLPGDPDCCSVEEYPVKCGVSRIWTHAKYRRLGVARAMLDCARASFFYGSSITAQDMAFCAPTQAGKTLATRYCGTPNFYVYM